VAHYCFFLHILPSEDEFIHCILFLTFDVYVSKGKEEKVKEMINQKLD